MPEMKASSQRPSGAGEGLKSVSFGVFQELLAAVVEATSGFSHVTNPHGSLRSENRGRDYQASAPNSRLAFFFEALRGDYDPRCGMQNREQQDRQSPCHKSHECCQEALPGSNMRAQGASALANLLFRNRASPLRSAARG